MDQSGNRTARIAKHSARGRRGPGRDPKPWRSHHTWKTFRLDSRLLDQCGLRLPTTIWLALDACVTSAQGYTLGGLRRPSHTARNAARHVLTPCRCAPSSSSALLTLLLVDRRIRRALRSHAVTDSRDIGLGYRVLGARRAPWHRARHLNPHGRERAPSRGCVTTFTDTQAFSLGLSCYALEGHRSRPSVSGLAAVLLPSPFGTRQAANHQSESVASPKLRTRPRRRALQTPSPFTAQAGTLVAHSSQPPCDKRWVSLSSLSRSRASGRYRRASPAQRDDGRVSIKPVAVS
ncbi:hypothetical protein L1887_48622 [Cichorium endivia]|nr:hypothetical protein L1887_48622 [Cichorium endivia]